MAPPNTKFGGAAEAFDSFFSSGFPKAKVRAAGSLPACNDPNVGGVLDVLVARLGSPNL